MTSSVATTRHLSILSFYCCCRHVVVAAFSTFTKAKSYKYDCSLFFLSFGQKVQQLWSLQSNLVMPALETWIILSLHPVLKDNSMSHHRLLTSGQSYIFLQNLADSFKMLFLIEIILCYNFLKITICAPLLTRVAIQKFIFWPWCYHIKTT